MDISIIIPSFNTRRLLKKCLLSIYKSLERSYIKYEIIVVDNASTDGSFEMVKDKFPKVNIIKNKNNIGYGKANNQAEKLANGKYILFLNSDIKAQDIAIEKLYKFISKNSEVKIAGGKLLNPDKTSQPSCGPFYSLPVAFAVLFLRGDKFRLTRYSPNKVKVVDWLSGACIMMEKKVFEKVGKFDESIFMYMEEVEFLYRAKKLGYNAYFYPEARFVHFGAASSKGKQQPIINIFQGLVYFYKEHKSGAELFILQLMLLTKAIIGIAVGKNIYKQAIREAIKPK